MKYTFGDIVVVDGGDLGVIVKSWTPLTGPTAHKGTYHEVYIRMSNEIKEYYEHEIQRYLVRHKYLSQEEKGYQSNAINTK